MPDTQSPATGDIFRDKDPRMEGRHLKVMSVDSRHAYVVNCGPDGAVRTGRKTRINLRGLETRFERVGGSRQREDLERAVIDAVKVWREADREVQRKAVEFVSGGFAWKEYNRTLAALRAAADELIGEKG